MEVINLKFREIVEKAIPGILFLIGNAIGIAIGLKILSILK